MPTLPLDAAVPAGSLILVTGANGFVGAHVVDQALAYGYHVRGSVRDPQKCQWLQEYADKTYGPGKFELVKVEKLDEEGSLDEAVKGCAGVIHVASNVSFTPDPNVVVNEAINFTMSALKSAAKEPSIKRFVLTSSSAAATQGKLNEAYDLTPESYSTWAVEAAWKPPPYEQDRILPVYAASKTQAEQEMWKFVKEQKPGFVANSVLPDFVTGKPVNLEKQGYPSSIGALYALWMGNEFFKVLPPQYMVDAQDTALLHIAGLAAPDAKSERIFAYAFQKTWTDWIERLKRMYPEHKFPDPPENEGKYIANVTAQPRAEKLLQWLGKPGWRPMEESIKEVCDTMPA